MLKNDNLAEIYEKEALEKTQLVSYNYTAAKFKKQKILEEASVGKNKKALEIGCGEGQLINYVEADYKLGIDISPTRIKQAKKNAEVIGTNSAFLVRDARSLSLGNKKFDVIICSELIEHLPRPEELLREIKKVMKKESKLILTTPNFFSLRRLIAKIVTGRSGDRTHLHTFSYKKLEVSLKKNGLRIVKHIPLTFEYIFYNRIPFGKFFDKFDSKLRIKIAEKFPNLSDLIFLIIEREK